jgi:VanZ family protein
VLTGIAGQADFARAIVTTGRGLGSEAVAAIDAPAATRAAIAVLATGYSRIWLAAVLTFLVGVSWELVQTTVVGHNPRVVDLFPNLVGIAVGWIIAFMSVFLWRSTRSRSATSR